MPFSQAVSRTTLLAGLFHSAFLTLASATIVTYDPGLNTLPESQGYTFTQDAPAPAPSVSGGILFQGLTSDSGTQYWERSDVPFNFDTGFVLEVTLKVGFSTYDPNAAGPGAQRSGWYMSGTDLMGRRFIIGIDSDGVVVNTDATLMVSNGLSIRGFDTTNGFHTYRLVVSGGTGTFFIDNVSFGSTPVGAIVDATSPDRIFFGDGSGPPQSQTQLSLFRYSDTSAIPEPGTLALLALGLVPLGRALSHRLRRS